MLMLMDGHPLQIHCHKCHRCRHVARDCSHNKKKPGCYDCSDLRHKSTSCPFRKWAPVQVWVEEEVTKEVQEMGNMTLFDRITLLDRLEWTPLLCKRCGKKDLKACEVGLPQV
jgi:hypothetical protein